MRLDTKTEIVKALDRLPEQSLQQVLEYVRSMPAPDRDSHDDRVLAIAEELFVERAQLYRRLADS